VLRYTSVQKCVMVDIDKEVCQFCAEHLEANNAAFRSVRLLMCGCTASRNVFGVLSCFGRPLQPTRAG
jgi:hypothetical protein